MAAYAVIARIGRADPHLTLLDLDDDFDQDRNDGPGTLVDAPAVIERPREASLADRIAERLFWLRVGLSQMTFFLFDAESWRR